MPTYEYQCEKCQREFEVRQRITEAPLTACEVCGGRVKRLLSPAPFILKGEGWYVTDYPSESRKKAREAEKKTPSNGSADKADKPAAADKPADKPAAATTSSSTTGASAPSAPAKSD
ncbi:MAG: transcriptional regulator [Candidatus Rokuibacteriota bacterium]|nr:MAG: transcriptional regulator [Candidatus Rokubacteria bacterium]